MSHPSGGFPLWFLIGRSYFKKPVSDIKGISDAKVSRIIKIMLSDWIENAGIWLDIKYFILIDLFQVDKIKEAVKKMTQASFILDG